MNEPFLPAGYVLPNVSPEDFHQMLSRIKKTLGMIELDFSTADLLALRMEFQSLASQTQSLSDIFGISATATNRTDNLPSAIILSSGNWIPPALRPTDLAAKTANYGSIEAFQRAVEEVICARQAKSPQIDKVLGNLARACHPKTSSEQAQVDYYAQFLPSQEDLATKSTAVICHILKRILDFFRRLFRTSTSCVTEVWSVLKDPDAAYLRLRGEMHEFQTRNPEFEWLEYVLLVPDLFRLYVRLMFDRDVAWPVKANVLGAIAYLVYPFDFLPEGLIGPIGYTDDAILMAKVILDLTNAARVAPGKLLEHWAGDPEVLVKVMWVSSQFEEHLDFFRMIHDWFRGTSCSKAVVA